MEQDIQDLFDDILQSLVATIQAIMVDRGLSPLSNLVKSVDVVWNGKSKQLDLIAEDYYYYVNFGRKPRVRKVPIFVLVDFIKQKGITPRPGKNGQFVSVNSLAFAFQNAIYRDGIAGLFYDAPVQRAMDSTVESILDNHLLDAITKGLDQEFEE